MKSKVGRWIRGILLLALLALVVIQFFRIDKENPDYDSGNDFLNSTLVSDDIKNVLRDACYDCHSYETEYPWYSNIAPISFWIKGHIDHGRENLNFSIWNSYNVKRQHHKLEECIEEIKEGKMPLKSFTWTHPESKLSQDQKTALLTWLDQKRAALE